MKKTKTYLVACALTSVIGLACGGDTDSDPMNPSGPACGDGTLDQGEVCDDGNTQSGDYCSSDCMKVIGSCGDGRIQFGVEVCDSGGSCGTQFCSADCQTFAGVCGDGIKQTPEGCDDGNVASLDGCSDACTLEGGAWTCTGSACGPTTCTM